MPTHVALLRGINVGGKNAVAMPDLEAAVAALGHTDVVTYIRTGNIVFTAAPGAGDGTGDPTADPTAGLAADLERTVADRLGVAARVVVLTCAELERVAADNPYSAAEDPRRVHAVFLPADPGPDVRAAVDAAVAGARGAGSRDEAQLVGRTLFLHTPDGFGRSVLVAALSRRAGPMGSKGAGTARNWATVTQLLSLCR
jgi:uncharacterized protein (DUF1697 family)